LTAAGQSKVYCKPQAGGNAARRQPRPLLPRPAVASGAREILDQNIMEINSLLIYYGRFLKLIL